MACTLFVQCAHDEHARQLVLDFRECVLHFQVLHDKLNSMFQATFFVVRVWCRLTCCLVSETQMALCSTSTSRFAHIWPTWFMEVRGCMLSSSCSSPRTRCFWYVAR